MNTHRWVAQVMRAVQKGVVQTMTSITKTEPRWKASGLVRFLGLAGATVTLLRLSSYPAGVLYGLVAPEIGLFYAMGALLVGLGALLLGIAALVARRLTGWKPLAPLLVGLYYAATIPIQIVFFIGPNGKPSATLLAS